MTEHIEHPNLPAALAAFQAELPKLRKDMTGKIEGESKKTGNDFSYTYGYADLAQVTEEVSPILGRHGLSFTSTPTMEGQSFVLAYSLRHESGEVMFGMWPLPNPMTTDPKKVGSAITYARRYALMAVTNTFPDREDDDGDAASRAFSERQQATQNFDSLPKERPQSTGSAPTQRRAAAQPKGKDWSKASPAEIAEQRDKFRDPTFTLDKAERLYQWMRERKIHNRQVPDASIDGAPTSAEEIFADRLFSEVSGPVTTIERSHVKEIWRIATDLGLLDVIVAGDADTLGDMIMAAQAVVNADLETPNAAKLREKAEQSWQSGERYQYNEGSGAPDTVAMSRADNAEPAE